jgi:hypothetical protein
MIPVDRSAVMTTDGQPPREGYERDSRQGAPAPINPATGQHEAYWVLSDEERQRGFQRPLRMSYRHVGEKPQYPLVELDANNEMRDFGYSHYEAIPEEHRTSSMCGRYWTEEQLNGGCGTETYMSMPIAETYARDPRFYGSTFCCACGKHLPIAEFVWRDGTRLGS